MEQKNTLSQKLQDFFSQDDPKKRIRKYIAMVGIAFVVVGILIIHANQTRGDDLDLVYDGTMISLLGPQSQQVDLPLDDILAVDYTSRIEIGTMLNGMETDNCYWGTFQNDVWGTFRLFAEKKLTDYIVFETVDGKTLFNCNSQRETEALYDAIVQLLEKRLEL